MEPAKYKHLANFLHQRGQRIPGVPFLSLWQFASALGFGFVGYVLQLPPAGSLSLGLLALVAFYVYHGEFLGRRVLAIAAVYSLSLFGRERILAFEPGWAQLAGGGPARQPATILLEGEGGVTVLA